MYSCTNLTRPRYLAIDVLLDYDLGPFQLVSVAFLKVLHARTGEYIGLYFVESTSLEEGELAQKLKERFGPCINIVTLDNAAGALIAFITLDTISNTCLVRHVIHHMFRLNFLSCTAHCDVASTIWLVLP